MQRGDVRRNHVAHELSDGVNIAAGPWWPDALLAELDPYLVAVGPVLEGKELVKAVQVAERGPKTEAQRRQAIKAFEKWWCGSSPLAPEVRKRLTRHLDTLRATGIQSNP